MAVWGALLFCGLVGMSKAQAISLPLPTGVQEMVSGFFKLLIAGEVEQAYGKLLAGGPLADSLQWECYWKQTQELNERYGLPVGYEVVQTAAIGRHLLRVVCAGFYEQRALWWELLFYRSPHRGWIVVELALGEYWRGLAPW